MSANHVRWFAVQYQSQWKVFIHKSFRTTWNMEELMDGWCLLKQLLQLALSSVSFNNNPADEGCCTCKHYPIAGNLFNMRHQQVNNIIKLSHWPAFCLGLSHLPLLDTICRLYHQPCLNPWHTPGSVCLQRTDQTSKASRPCCWKPNCGRPLHNL